MADSHAHSATAGHDLSHGGRPRPVYDDVNVPVLIMIGIVSAIVTFLIVAGVQGLAYRMESRFEQFNNRNYTAGAKAIRDIIESQRSLLQGGESGAKIPIGTAMEQTVARYSATQPARQHAGDGHAEGTGPDGTHGGASADGHGSGEGH